MSTYFKMYNATTDAPDPERYVPEPHRIVAHDTVGVPFRGQCERGVVNWSVMTIAHWIDLWDKWNAGKNGSGTFVIPGRTSGESWTTWRSVTAWAEEPRCEYAGNNVHNVTMKIVIP